RRENRPRRPQRREHRRTSLLRDGEDFGVVEAQGVLEPAGLIAETVEEIEIGIVRAIRGWPDVTFRTRAGPDQQIDLARVQAGVRQCSTSGLAGESPRIATSLR